MLLKGMFNATFNIDAAMVLAASGFKIMYIGDLDHELNRVHNGSIIPASLLAPPYNALQEVLDGNLAKFNAIYASHLETEECQLLIATVLTALLKGTSIVFLFPADTAELMYPQVLMQYIFTKFGIQIGTEISQCLVNPVFDDIILDQIYRYDCITSLEYIYLVTNTVTTLCMKKLIYELGIKVKNPNNYQEYLDWVERYHNRMISSGDILLTRPFSLDPSAERKVI